jgi:uncharacterized membrane protein YbhN (UPF0104 family)
MGSALNVTAPAALALFPFVMALTEAIKRLVGWTSRQSDRYGAMTSLGVGVGLCLLYHLLATPNLGDRALWAATVITGLASGLMASGLYSGTKSVTRT